MSENSQEVEEGHSRERCGFCRRSVLITKSGRFRVHGPVANRCSGSGSCPTVAAAPSPSPALAPTPGDHLSQVPIAFSQPPRVPSNQFLKRLPRGSRQCAAWKLAPIFRSLSSDMNNIAAWSRMLNFPSRCFCKPKRGGHKRNLATQVNKLINAEESRSFSPPSSRPSFRRSSHLPIDILAAKVVSKIEEGDFRGAVRLACSNDSLASFSDETLEALKAKHPQASSIFSIPAIPSEVIDSFVEFSTEEVAKAIRSFPNSSSGGPDGLRPQHLKDMIGPGSGEGGVAFLKALTAFVNEVALGKTPDVVRPFFFGASLIALWKEDGGIRPIAVGCTLRRLVSKCAINRFKQSANAFFSPHQLGFAVPNGAEAAVHAARIYLQNLPSENAMLKLDFSNAFNSLSREKMFQAVRDLAPQLLPLVLSAYSSPSSLFFGDSIVQSCEGVQQGDPLGPLLFCLSVHSIVPELKSEFRVLYQDDLTLGGSLEDVIHDFHKVSELGANLGLHLNHSKSEVICKDHSTLGALLVEVPGLSVVHPDNAHLLGSPIGSAEGVNSKLLEKCESLKVMGDRLCKFGSHVAFCLLKHAFAMPKLLYLLRSSPCFSCLSLLDFDELQRALISKILNVSLDDRAWVQASLPVRNGGIGIRRADQLAPSAFLASATACSDLIHKLVPERLHDVSYDLFVSALVTWSQLCDDHSPPCAPESARQRSWDDILVKATYDELLNLADGDLSRARLLAAAQEESGSWLHACP